MPLFRAQAGLVARGGSLASSTSCCCSKSCLACPGRHDYWVESPTCAQLPEPANCASDNFSRFHYRNGACEEIAFPNFSQSHYTMARTLDGFGWTGVSWLFVEHVVTGVPTPTSEYELFNLTWGFRLACSPPSQGSKFFFGVDRVFVTTEKQSNPCSPSSCLRFQKTELRAGTRLIELPELATSDEQVLVVSECLQPSFKVKLSNAGIEVAGTFVPFLESKTTVSQVCQTGGGCTDYLPAPQVPDRTYTVYRRPCKLENPLP